MINNHIEAVVFDFDGTLAKLNIDFSLMRKTVLDLTAAYNVPMDGLSKLFVLEMIEAGGELISIHNPGSEGGYIKTANKLISNIEIEAAKKGELLDGIKRMLGDLETRNIKAGVVTRNCQEAVREIFPDIDSFCKAVITREFAGNVKPHPEHLRITLEKLGTAPEHSVMVGDHPMDISIGKKMGTYTVGVLTGYSGTDALCEAGADLIIESAAEITDYLP
ncbi:MAG: HAD family hydrolase [Thermodesulfobacteriota bacterium]|nr:HAD family hydrolase [Thermodesulfobacteriota bacterium]